MIDVRTSCTELPEDSQKIHAGYVYVLTEAGSLVQQSIYSFFYLVFPAAAAGGGLSRGGRGPGGPWGDGDRSPGFSGRFSVRGSAGATGSPERRHDGKTAGRNHERHHRKSQTLQPRQVRHKQVQHIKWCLKSPEHVDTNSTLVILAEKHL